MLYNPKSVRRSRLDRHRACKMPRKRRKTIVVIPMPWNGTFQRPFFLITAWSVKYIYFHKIISIEYAY